MKLTGQSCSNFTVKESYNTIDFNVLEKMVLGDEDSVPLYIIRDYVDSSVTERICVKFFEIISNNGDNRKDEYVEVNQIGATQFGKSARDYFVENIKVQGNIDKLLNSINNPLVQNDFLLENSFRNFFSKKGITFRPSYYRGNYSNLFTARLWKDDKNKNFILKAHDDLAQLNIAEIDNYEIGMVKNVVACNLCVKNSSGTELIVWNLSPDVDCKKRLNIENTGYPYPIKQLEGIDYLELKTNPGDLYFINANFIHAIKNKGEKKDRISIGRFIGQISDSQIVYWT
jgi:L-isoleucine 31-dioxygenase